METNEELIKAWIGEKNQENLYQKVMNGGFCWVTWILPDLHLATRKMYLEAFLYIFIVIVYSFVVALMNIPENLVDILTFIIRIIMGFSFYPLYKKHILRKIRKYEQQGLSYEEQLSIAQNNGGDKITGKTVAVIILTVIEAIVLYFVAANGLAIWSQLGKQNYDYNITQNDDGTSIWSIDGCQITYDTNEWKITEVNGITTLQYKDEISYVTYTGKRNNDEGIEVLDNSAFRDAFEAEIEKNFTENNLKISSTEYNKINNELYEIVVSFCRDDYNGKMYIYSNDTTIVPFTIIYENSNVDFEIAVQEMLRTIKIEDEDSVVEQNNDIETSISNKNNSISSKENVGKLKFSLPKGYQASEYNTDSYSSYNNEEIWTNIYISTSSSSYYESTEEFVKQYIYNLESVNDFESENINGIKWIKYEIQDTYTKEYYYITKYEDKYYLVEFVIIDEEYENDAIKHFETIKNSFELQ